MIRWLLSFFLVLVSPTQLKEKEFSWIKYIVSRIRRNKNFLAFCSGPTGSGKSYTTIAVAEMLAKALGTPFSIDNIVFSSKEQMQLANSGKLVKGSVIVAEEVGVTQSARSWQSNTNKVLNFYLQTFRHRNFVLLMNAPFMDFVDSQTRRLFHAEWKTTGIDFVKKETLVKPYCLQFNPRNKKTYYKYLRVKKEGVRGLVPVTLWRVHEPSDELKKPYEQKKLKFTTELNEKILAGLEKEDGDKRKQGVLTIEQNRVYELLKERLTVPQICDKLNVKKSWIYDCMKKIQLKGHTITPVYSTDGLESVTHYEAE